MIWIWLLLSIPMDRTVCTVWVNSPPTVADMRQACPWPLPGVELLVWRGIDRSTGEIMCELPAEDLPVIKCDLYPLSNFNIVVIDPMRQEWLCTVETLTPVQPTETEISARCPGRTAQLYREGKVLISSGGSKLPDPAPDPVCPMPIVTIGSGLLETPADPSGLYTREPLALLGGRLLWWGIALPDCSSWSGIDPVSGGATACGMKSAAPALVSWQNRYNDVIWYTATEVGVPAGLLKRMIMVESQFWPLWKPPHGERGLLQLTESGADTVLQYSRRLFDYYCPLAIFPGRCSQWGTLAPDEKVAIIVVMMNDLGCPYCTPDLAARHARDTMMLNAEILKAYYCHAAAVTGTASWVSALVDFNAGQDCLLTGCQAGKDYVAEVMR